MSISIQLALTVGKTLRNDELKKDIPGKGKHFDESYIKALSPEDRKVCYRALNTIEHSQLSSFEPDASEDNEAMKQRVSNVTSAFNTPLEDIQEDVPEWYKRPFLWIADCVHSFVLWFKNTFLGRVSSRKLYNKVETYLNDFSRAQKRLVLLTADDGLIAKAEQERDRCVENQRKFLTSFKILVEAHEALRMIDLTMPKNDKSKIQGTENFRLKIKNAWIVDSYNADVIPCSNLKEVVNNIIGKASSDVQAYLKDLFNAAQAEDEDNEEEVIQLLGESGQRLIQEIKQQYKTGNMHRNNVKEATEQLSNLENECNLLSKKYPN